MWLRKLVIPLYTSSRLGIDALICQSTREYSGGGFCAQCVSASRSISESCLFSSLLSDLHGTLLFIDHPVWTERHVPKMEADCVLSVSMICRPGGFQSLTSLSSMTGLTFKRHFLGSERDTSLLRHTSLWSRRGGIC